MVLGMLCIEDCVPRVGWGGDEVFMLQVSVAGPSPRCVVPHDKAWQLADDSLEEEMAGVSMEVSGDCLKNTAFSDLMPASIWRRGCVV